MKHFKILSVLAAIATLTIGSVAAYASSDTGTATTTTTKKTTTHKKAAKKKHKTSAAKGGAAGTEAPAAGQ